MYLTLTGPRPDPYDPFLCPNAQILRFFMMVLNSENLHCVIFQCKRYICPAGDITDFRGVAMKCLFFWFSCCFFALSHFPCFFLCITTNLDKATKRNVSNFQLSWCLYRDGSEGMSVLLVWSHFPSHFFSLLSLLSWVIVVVVWHDAVNDTWFSHQEGGGSKVNLAVFLCQ